MENQTQNQSSAQKKKILFIEDDKIFQRIIKETLTENDFGYVGAYDGDSGLKLAEEESPDLILLDILLPNKNGFEVLYELKASPRLKSTPVIILSNLDGAQNRNKAEDLGVTKFLNKTDYLPDDIIEEIKQVL